MVLTARDDRPVRVSILHARLLRHCASINSRPTYKFGMSLACYSHTIQAYVHIGSGASRNSGGGWTSPSLSSLPLCLPPSVPPYLHSTSLPPPRTSSWIVQCSKWLLAPTIWNNLFECYTARHAGPGNNLHPHYSITVHGYQWLVVTHFADRSRLKEIDRNFTQHAHVGLLWNSLYKQLRHTAAHRPLGTTTDFTSLLALSSYQFHYKLRILL